jgi:hypothetical protein
LIFLNTFKINFLYNKNVPIFFYSISIQLSPATISFLLMVFFILLFFSHVFIFFHTMFRGEIMKYNPNILSFLFMCIAVFSFIAYLNVRNTLRTHPIFVLSISLFALLGTFSFIKPMEDTYFPLLILIGSLCISFFY